MRRIAVVVALAIILLIPVSSAYVPADTSEKINVNSYPQITILTKSNTSFNITFFGLAVNIPALGMKGLAKFENEDWHIHGTGNRSVSYSTNVNLLDSLSQSDSAQTQNDNTNSFIEDNSMMVTVFVNISKYTGNGSTLNIFNGSSTNHAASVSSLAQNTIEINSSIVTHFKSKVPMVLSLVQKISGQLSDSPLRMPVAQFIARLDNHRSTGMGIAFGATANLSRAYGLYWWMSNYTLNSNLHPLNMTLIVKDNSPYVAFSYEIPSNRTSNIEQDPYFTMLGGLLVNFPIVQKTVKQIESYILQNAEYFAAGILAGTVLIFGAYAGYRRRRF